MHHGGSYDLGILPLSCPRDEDMPNHFDLQLSDAFVSGVCFNPVTKPFYRSGDVAARLRRIAAGRAQTAAGKPSGAEMKIDSGQGLPGVQGFVASTSEARRSVMRTFGVTRALLSVAVLTASGMATSALAQEKTVTVVVAAQATVAAGLAAPAADQSTPGESAAEAALHMANMMDGAGGGVSNEDLISALEGAAGAGQPMALYRLGMMYENGDGVAKDPVKAFGYFSRIANDHADAAPRGLEADIVAQSFVKVGEYYKEGLPDAGIAKDEDRSYALLMHAATYFGDADAQYRIGELYLEDEELGISPLQGARWFSLAARKGYGPAQAKLGDMLFNGEGIVAQPAEGLMWLTLAHQNTAGTADEKWVDELLDHAVAAATPDVQKEAAKMTQIYGPQFHTN
jgi:TPR repeat protein